ncbi:MAG: hypothetical protein ACLRWQ_05660 [Flavonifractor plautii]
MRNATWPNSWRAMQGETFAGTVSGVARFGLFVLLPGGGGGPAGGGRPCAGAGSYRYGETRLSR